MDSKQLFNIHKGKQFQDAVPEKSGHSIVAARFLNKLYDLSDVAPDNGEVEFIQINSPEGEKILLHSTAHLLANAIVNLYPDALPNTSNENEDTFYYDFNMKPYHCSKLFPPYLKPYWEQRNLHTISV